MVWIELPYYKELLKMAGVSDPAVNPFQTEQQLNQDLLKRMNAVYQDFYDVEDEKFIRHSARQFGKDFDEKW